MSGVSPVTVIVSATAPSARATGMFGTAVDLQDDAVLHIGAEPLQHHLQTIRTDRNARKRKRPVRVGDDVALESGVGLRDGHARAGKDTAARVFHDAGDLSRRLGQDDRRGAAERTDCQLNTQLRTRFIPTLLAEHVRKNSRKIRRKRREYSRRPCACQRAAAANSCGRRASIQRFRSRATVDFRGGQKHSQVLSSLTARERFDRTSAEIDA